MRTLDTMANSDLQEYRRMRQSLAETVDILKNSFRALLERGEKLDELEYKSQQLNSFSKKHMEESDLLLVCPCCRISGMKYVRRGWKLLMHRMQQCLESEDVLRDNPF